MYAVRTPTALALDSGETSDGLARHFHGRLALADLRALPLSMLPNSLRRHLGLTSAGKLDAFVEQLRDRYPDDFNIDVWTDASNRLRKLAFSYVHPTLGTQLGLGDAPAQVRATVQIFDYGEAVDVPVPPATQVSPMVETPPTSTGVSM